MKQVIYKTLEEIELMRESALLVSKTLEMLVGELAPGVTPMYLDKLAEEFIRDHQAKPGFKGLYGCPSTLLTSVNEQVVHGLPTDRPLENGDIIAIDCGVLKNDFYGDHAYTFGIGEVDPKLAKLLQVTKESLYLGIEKAVAGNRIGDIGHAIQKHAESHGYGVVREMTGHGLGRSLHEGPNVPNYGRPGRGKKIKNGMTIAIEPMINLGTHKIKTLSDGWTVVTQDGLGSAHFEHDIAIINGKPELLSSFEGIEKAIQAQQAVS